MYFFISICMIWRLSPEQLPERKWWSQKRSLRISYCGGWISPSVIKSRPPAVDQSDLGNAVINGWDLLRGVWIKLFCHTHRPPAMTSSAKMENNHFMIPLPKHVENMEYYIRICVVVCVVDHYLHILFIFHFEILKEKIKKIRIRKCGIVWIC